MTPPQGTARAPSGRLDARSRTAVTGCGVRLVLAGGLSMGLAMMDTAMPAKALGTLSVCLSANAMFACVIALRRGEAFNGAFLNRWDESLVFLSLARLAHFAQGFWG